MTRLPWLWPAIILFSAAAVAVVTFSSIASPLRPLVAFWFLLVCPGMAFVRLLELEEGFAQWTLAIALSLALDAVVAITMLYAGMWSPNWGLVVLIGISLVGVVLQVVVAYSRMTTAADKTTAAEHSGAPDKAAAGQLSPRHLGGIAAGGVVLLALLLWARSGLSEDRVNAGQPEAAVPSQSTAVVADAYAGPTATSTATPIPSPMPTVTLTPVLETPTALEILTPTPSPTIFRTPSTTPTAIPSPTPCIVSPPSTWVQYTVRFGDALSVLATERETIVDVAGRVNCLKDINVLGVGQVLWLPPLAATGTPTPEPP